MNISILAGYTADRELHPTPKDEIMIVTKNKLVKKATVSSLDKKVLNQ